MEQNRNEFPRPPETPDWAQQVLAPAKPPFAAGRKELYLAFGMYVLAYIYMGFQWWALPLFAVGFAAAAEYLFWDVRRPRESWVWLGCMALAVAALVWRGLHPVLMFDSRLPDIEAQGYVLSDNLVVLILHVFAVYWLMSRSGRLTGGESGHLLPLDALYAFVIIPFENFFLRIRCVVYALKPRKGKTANAGAMVAAVLAAFVVLVLLAMAMTQLSAADDTFGQLLAQIRSVLTPNLEWTWAFQFLCSLPVGAYVFGLLAGLGRKTPETMQAHGAAATKKLSAIHVVPNGVWLTALGLFSALYLTFFVVQGRYLFGAFTRTLPEDFTVAEYARQGFFELCRVMAINFTIFWLVTRTERSKTKAGHWMVAALLIESMLFAVIALSKLVLYIDCFGFTPKRLQSTWLVCVLLFGTACMLYTHLTEKKSMRAFLIFGAVTLTLLTLC